MDGKNILPLSVGEHKLYVNFDRIQSTKEELQLFLEDIEYMNSKEFSMNVLFSQEIKANNTIEGYKDDVNLVYNILKNNLYISDKSRMQRIKNLCEGYHYILDGKDINKDNLKELYSILSKDLLEQGDLDKMGEYYRNEPVYIYYTDNLMKEPDTGIEPQKIEDSMNELFSFINSNNNLETTTDYFIKSQIMHFQFVNIHPYYDINGRTARTCSMWYLLNNNSYPYIIFNRAIGLNKRIYCKVIRDVKKYHNATYFLNFMLENVKIELEKEHIIDMIKANSDKLTAIDYQTIYYVLSMNGILSMKDFSTFYNKFNDKKRTYDIYNEMIVPLLDKHILKITRDTKSFINGSMNNFIFELNDSKYEVDPNKIKRLIIKK